MKTYILKYDVINIDDLFPAGIIVKITDDYWGNTNNDKNTGFTVVSGKLKGQKGCVVNGLEGWLLENTETNRKIFKEFAENIKKLTKSLEAEEKAWEKIPTAIL